MIKRSDKRAQGLSVNAIILIVLGVIILVMLIVGFTLGWSKIKEMISPSNNVDDIVQKCNIACNTNKVYDYCSVENELKAEGKKIKTTCNLFVNVADLKSAYGFESCSISCTKKPCNELKISDVIGSATASRAPATDYNVKALTDNPIVDCFISKK